MTKVFLEYIWLDGNSPQRLRSKTKVINYDKVPTLHKPHKYPKWSFDGSSTKQAKAGNGNNTDCILQPVFIKKDPFRGGEHRLVLCEVYGPDGTPHKSNNRAKLRKLLDSEEFPIKDVPLMEFKLEDKDLPWFGWEQEYTLIRKVLPFSEGEGIPLGFGFNNGQIIEPREQGDYYCGIGSDNVIGRAIVEDHLTKCCDIGIEMSGINAEVMVGQWEYQVGPVTPLMGSDQLWISRYILERVAEEHNVKISLHPKPVKEGKWNGSGCHVNFSTKETRSTDGLEVIVNTMELLKETHQEHIKVYGESNDERLVGELETSGINDFSYGYSTRDTSIRIPLQTKEDGFGYFEDRRPASNCDPYLVSERMLKTVYKTERVTDTVR